MILLDLGDGFGFWCEPDGTLLLHCPDGDLMAPDVQWLGDDDPRCRTGAELAYERVAAGQVGSRAAKLFYAYLHGLPETLVLVQPDMARWLTPERMLAQYRTRGLSSGAVAVLRRVSRLGVVESSDGESVTVRISTPNSACSNTDPQSRNAADPHSAVVLNPE